MTKRRRPFGFWRRTGRLRRIELKRAELALERDQLRLAAERAAHATEQIPHATPSSESSDTPARPRFRKRMWTVAIAASLLIAGVVVAIQVPAYEGFFRGHSLSNFGVFTLNLAVFAPLAVECIAWVFTSMSVLAVVNNKPHHRYERVMWFFCCIAAFVNADHNIRPNDWITGVVLGGLSITSPLIITYALRWDRDLQSVLDADGFRAQFRAQLIALTRRIAQAVLHPLNTPRAVWICTQFNVSFDSAYRVALLGKYKPIKRLLADEVGNRVSNIAARVYTTGDTTDEPKPTVATEPTPPAILGPLHGGVLTADDPGHSEVLDAFRIDLAHLSDVNTLLAGWGLHTPTHGAHATRADHTVHDGDETKPGVHRDDGTVHGHGVHDTVHDSGAQHDVHGARPNGMHGVQEANPVRDDRAHHDSAVHDTGMHRGVHEPTRDNTDAPPNRMHRVQKDVHTISPHAFPETARTRAYATAHSTVESVHETAHATGKTVHDDAVHTRASTSAPGLTDLVIAHWWKCVHDPDTTEQDLTPKDLLDALALTGDARVRARPTVSKALKACKTGKHPDPALRDHQH